MLAATPLAKRQMVCWLGFFNIDQYCIILLDIHQFSFNLDLAEKALEILRILTSLSRTEIAPNIK